ATEEVLGPVLPVWSVADLDEALKHANASPFGLGSSIWTRDLDAATHAAAERLGMERPKGRATHRRRANFQPAHTRKEPLEKGVQSVLGTVNAFHGEAGLACIEEPPDTRRAGRGIEVGVLADDERIGSAQLERDPLGARCGRNGDALSGCSRAGERDLADTWVADERLPDLRATTDDVQDSSRQAGLVQQLRDANRRERRRRSWLCDDGIPGDQRGGDLVREQKGWKIPSHDRRDHTERAPNDQSVGVVVEIGNMVPAKIARQPGVVLEGDAEAMDLEARLPQRLAVLGGQQPRQLVPMGQDPARAATE
ncbi:MAG: aldehyde dehydrogenase family protein, partial [Solirubrobacterales bacterium]|nr:aldehyde dehydrogenase family protein [Solirubrobacterales bacterium]